MTCVKQKKNIYCCVKTQHPQIIEIKKHIALKYLFLSLVFAEFFKRFVIRVSEGNQL